MIDSERVLSEYANDRKASTKMHVRWKAHTTNARGALGVSRHYNPWTAELKKTSVPSTWEREREMVECGWIERWQQREWASVEEAASDWFVDISQGIQTKACGGVRTLCGGAALSFP